MVGVDLAANGSGRLLLAELAAIFLLLGLTFWLQGRKTDFI